MATVISGDVEWKFRIGKTEISFPNPNAGINENKRILSQHFPQLRWTTIYEEDAVYENGCMILPVIPPPIKVNG